MKDRIDELRTEWNSKQQQQQQSSDNNDNDSDDTKIPVVIVEAAVLLDAGWDDILDGIWVVTASKSTAITRLIETRNLSQEEALKRYDAQISRRGIGNLQDEINQGIVSSVIENNGSIEDLKVTLKDALSNPKSWKKG